MSQRIYTVLCLTFLASVVGCSASLSYVTPSSGVTMTQITDDDIDSYYGRQPASPFPANIAIIRVQDTGYVSHSYHGYGGGRYSIVTTRDIETDDAYDNLISLPMIDSVAPIGRILSPANASSIKDLRTPAAKLRADLLLVYSVETKITVDGNSYGPLSALSLGFIRNKKAHVTSTVAGALVDVRTGFIYGTTEATAREQKNATVWSTAAAIDASRLIAEKAAFSNFVSEFGRLWKGVVEQHAATVPKFPVAAIPQATSPDTHYRIQFDTAIEYEVVED